MSPKSYGRQPTTNLKSPPVDLWGSSWVTDVAGGWDARMRGWGAVPPRSAQMVGKGGGGGGNHVGSILCQVTCHFSAPLQTESIN